VYRCSVLGEATEEGKAAWRGETVAAEANPVDDIPGILRLSTKDGRPTKEPAGRRGHGILPAPNETVEKPQRISMVSVRF
jgi:hypothetical protein